MLPFLQRAPVATIREDYERHFEKILRLATSFKSAHHQAELCICSHVEFDCEKIEKRKITNRQ